MANVQAYTLADGSRRYRVRWLSPDRKKHSKTFDARRDADRFADEQKRKRALGGLYQAPCESLASFLEGWLGRYTQRVRPSTLARRREALAHLAPFMSLTLDQIRPDEVEDHIMSVGGRAPRQAQIALQTLKMVLRNAKERGHTVNEAIFGIKPPHTEQRERQFLSWEQVDDLALNTSDAYANLVRLAALTGLQTGRALRAHRRMPGPGDRHDHRRARHIPRRAGSTQDTSEPPDGRPLSRGTACPEKTTTRPHTQRPGPDLPIPGRWSTR